MKASELPLGASVTADGVHFAVWAPKAERVEVEVHDPGELTYHPLGRGEGGLHAGTAPGLGAGARYKYRLDGADAYPDPRSRFQPDGVHDPSEVIDPTTFPWSDDAWPGLTMDGLVIYECHVGAYTAAGTYEALAAELPELTHLGIDAVELMPVSECPGRRNWGYDGVDLFAPSRNYGRPDDLRRFVDAAHRLGLGVIVDVVYNHLGPDGNYLRAFSDDYFTDRRQTPWGEAINYDGPNSRWVRDFVIDNACSWIREYHLDGIRLDATDTIVDDSPTHLLAELTERVRAASDRRVVVIAEDARNDVRLIRPRARDGFGLDAVWADDFHHELRVLLTNAHENYYANYTGSMEAIAKAITEGFIYQGQSQPENGQPRGTRVTDEPASAFIFCLQNHDQVGNRPFGDRLHHEIERGRYAVASTVLLFAPRPILLFMGQEFGASTPFLYFTDHDPELGRLVTEGRRREFSGFRVFKDDEMRGSIPDPQAESTFLASKLRLSERQHNAGLYALYRALLALRHDDPVLRAASRTRANAQALGAQALGAQAILVHRWLDDRHRLLIANFGAATSVPFETVPIPRERLGQQPRIVLDTTWQQFGGIDEPATIDGARQTIAIPARAAVILEVEP